MRKVHSTHPARLPLFNNSLATHLPIVTLSAALISLLSPKLDLSRIRGRPVVRTLEPECGPQPQPLLSGAHPVPRPTIHTFILSSCFRTIPRHPSLGCILPRSFTGLCPLLVAGGHLLICLRAAVLIPPVLVCFCQGDTNQSPRKREHHLRTCSLRTLRTLRTSENIGLRGILFIVIGCRRAQSSVGGVIPLEGGSRFYKESAKQDSKWFPDLPAPCPYFL